jgi:hypothetical protein
VADEEYDHVVFLDAVEFGGAPGSVVLLDASEMAARFPQISTHKLSLGLLAKQAEANDKTRAWLLGVQPQSLKPGEDLTPTVRATLELLLELLRACWKSNSGGAGAVRTSLNTARLAGGASSQVCRLGEGECESFVTSAAPKNTEGMA